MWENKLENKRPSNGGTVYERVSKRGDINVL